MRLARQTAGFLLAWDTEGKERLGRDKDTPGQRKRNRNRPRRGEALEALEALASSYPRISLAYRRFRGEGGNTDQLFFKQSFHPPRYEREVKESPNRRNLVDHLC